MRGLEDLGRVRLSANFYLRDFLYSEIANFYGIPNIPDDPDLAIAAAVRTKFDWTALVIRMVSARSASAAPR